MPFQAPLAEVKYAKIDTSGNGDLVALVAAKKIRVLSLQLSTASATTVKFQSGGSTDLTGAITTAAGVPLLWPYNPYGHIQTAAGEKLNLVVGAGQVSGYLTYHEV